MNMKKIKLLLVIITLSMGLSLKASDPNPTENIDLKIKVTRPVDEHGAPERSLVQVPVIFIGGGTLFFYTPCDNLTLQIVARDGGVCFETIISEGTEQITLPSYLGGDYEIRIIDTNCVYYGYINI